jgi:integrase
MTKRLPTELKRDHDSAFVRWNAKRIYFGRWGSRDASRAFAEWLSEMSAAPEIAEPKNRITIARCVARYMIHAESYYPSGEFNNISSAIAALLASAALLRAVDFGPVRLKQLQKSLATEKNEDGSLKYARSTINSKINRIRRCLRWCASEELIPVEVVTALETVPGLPQGRGLARESKPVQPVPREVVVATLPFLSPTVAAMVQTQYLCGMRPQDVCRMTTGAIDRSHDVWIYRPVEHKGTHRGQSLMKAIPIAAQAFLVSLLRSDPDEPLFSPLDTKRHFGNAGKRAKRGFYSTGSYGKSVFYGIAQANKAAIVEAAEQGREPSVVPHWQPNQLRHAIATDLRASIGIEAAQAYLGHLKPDTTLIYAAQTEVALREIAKGISLPVSSQQSPQSLP